MKASVALSLLSRHCASENHWRVWSLTQQTLFSTSTIVKNVEYLFFTTKRRLSLFGAAKIGSPTSRDVSKAADQMDSSDITIAASGLAKSPGATPWAERRREPEQFSSTSSSSKRTFQSVYATTKKDPDSTRWWRRELNDFDEMHPEDKLRYLKETKARLAFGKNGIRLPDHTMRLLCTSRVKPRFSAIDEKASRTDRRLDGPTDRPSYRDAVASKKRDSVHC